MSLDLRPTALQSATLPARPRADRAAALQEPSALPCPSAEADCPYCSGPETD